MNTQLDPTIVNLAKAIRQTESGGNFTAKGKSGEYGAYQYTEPTWNQDSQKYLGTIVPLKESSKEQQNEVAYKKLSDLKGKGYNVGQIASIWNSGDSEAYTGKFSNGNPSIGKNKYGVHFDVPQYAKSVASTYQQYKQGIEKPTVTENSSTVTEQPQSNQINQTNQPDESNYPVYNNPIQKFGTGVFKGLEGTMANFGSTFANQTVGRVINAIQGNGFNPTQDGSGYQAISKEMNKPSQSNEETAGHLFGLATPVIAGGIEGLASSGAESTAEAFPTVEQYMNNPELYEQSLKAAPVAEKMGLFKQLVRLTEGGLAFEAGKGLLKNFFGKYIAPEVMPGETTINPAP